MLYKVFVEIFPSGIFPNTTQIMYALYMCVGYVGY